MAPGIANQRVAISEARLPVRAGVRSPCAGSGKPALCFDGSGTDQSFPMILSGVECEGRGQQNKFRPGAAKTPEHIGKANVIAYGATGLHPIKVEGYDGIAGYVVVTLAITSAIRSDNVEEVYFSVARDFSARRIEHHSGVGQLSTQPLADGPAVHVDSILASNITKEIVCRTAVISRPRLRQTLPILESSLHAAAQTRPNLGKADEARPVFAYSTVHQGLRLRNVRTLVLPRTHLKNTNSHYTSLVFCTGHPTSKMA